VRAVAAALLLLGCGRSHGTEPEPAHDAAGRPDLAGSSGAAAEAGSEGVEPMRDEDVGTAGCTPGDKRDATRDESGSYCVCVEDSGLRWRCFGPDPSELPAGGARGAPRAVCNHTFGHAGAGSCLVQWKCSDGRLYAISCIEGSCTCVVDNEPGAELEPMSACPEDVATINVLCGWKLESPER
jgi:hypothetical protein